MRLPRLFGWEHVKNIGKGWQVLAHCLITELILLRPTPRWWTLMGIDGHWWTMVDICRQWWHIFDGSTNPNEDTGWRATSNMIICMYFTTYRAERIVHISSKQIHPLPEIYAVTSAGKFLRILVAGTTSKTSSSVNPSALKMTPTAILDPMDPGS